MERRLCEQPGPRSIRRLLQLLASQTQCLRTLFGILGVQAASSQGSGSLSSDDENWEVELKQINNAASNKCTRYIILDRFSCSAQKCHDQCDGSGWAFGDKWCRKLKAMRSFGLASSSSPSLRTRWKNWELSARAAALCSAPPCQIVSVNNIRRACSSPIQCRKLRGVVGVWNRILWADMTFFLCLFLCAIKSLT